MLQPLRDVPFRLVINALSGKTVIAIDPNNPKDKALLDVLSEVAQVAGKAVNRSGIIRYRPNEVGNDIEEFVKNALVAAGFRASVPHTKSGKKKSTGYPDIEFRDKAGRIVYIECKTYNIENVDTTQRSFYLSPSDDFKVTEDGLHIGLSYEVFVSGRQGSDNIYKVKHWKLIDLEKLEVDVKYEFNSDNQRLYMTSNILNEGDF